MVRSSKKKRERKKRFKVRKRIDREHYIRLNIIKVTNIVKIHNSKSKKFRGGKRTAIKGEGYINFPIWLLDPNWDDRFGPILRIIILD